MPPLKKVILLLETSRAFGRELLYGIARYSKLHGPWSFYREPIGLKSSIPRLKNWNADGMDLAEYGRRFRRNFERNPGVQRTEKSEKCSFF